MRETMLNLLKQTDGLNRKIVFSPPTIIFSASVSVERISMRRHNRILTSRSISTKPVWHRVINKNYLGII